MDKNADNISKVNRKLGRIDTNKISIKNNISFHNKYKYASYYNNEFSNLCKLYRNSTFYKNGVVNRGSDKSEITEKILLNKELLDYYEKYPFSLKENDKLDKIRCTHYYLNCLLPEDTIVLDTIVIDTPIITPLPPPRPISKGRIRSEINEKIKGFKDNGDSVERRILIVKSGNKLAVRFEFYSNKNNGFEKNEYLINSVDNEVQNFCLLVQDSFALKGSYLYYSSIRGEADGDKFQGSKGIPYNTENSPLTDINLYITKLDHSNYDSISSFDFTKKNNEFLKNNCELAAARAFYAKALFEKTMEMYHIENLEIVDHSDCNCDSRDSSFYRKITFFIIFSNKEYAKIEDFFDFYDNYSLESSEDYVPNLRALREKKNYLNTKEYNLIKQRQLK
jgi:hypothetical protein